MVFVVLHYEDRFILTPVLWHLLCHISWDALSMYVSRPLFSELAVKRRRPYGTF